MNRIAFNRGFTLIELMVTVSLAAILLLLAVPSMQEMLATQRVRTVASELQIAAQETRSAALKYNRRAVARPVDASASWQGGWNIYIDNNVNATYESGTDTLVISHEALTGDTVITKSSGGNSNNFFAYTGTGFLDSSISGSANATWEISSPKTTRRRCLVIERSGRAKVQEPPYGSTCSGVTS
mgnify:FL=1